MSNKAEEMTMKQGSKRELKPKVRFPEFRNAPGWENEAMGEVYSFKGTNSFSRDQLNYESGTVKNIHYGDIHTKYPSSFDICKEKVPFINPSESLETIRPDNYCVEGDVIFADASEDLEGVGKSIEIVALNDERLLSGMHTILARQKRKILIIGFGGHLFKSARIRNQIKKEAQGAKVFGVSPTRLSNIEICYPPEKAEQQKIATCLTSLDELIAAHGQKLDALKTHEKGLMRQLFPLEGETLPRLRFPEFSNAPEWSEYTLIDVAKFRRGSFPQPYGLPEWYDEENGTPFIQVFDVGDNFRLKEKTKSKISNLAAEQSVFIPEGTLIITLQGSIGRVAITQYEAYIDRTLLLFGSFLKPIDKLFFAYIIHNLFEVEKEKAPGGIIKTITKEALSDFKIKLPCILEQQKIAACLSTIDELISTQAQKLDALKTHKIGLMQQLFPFPEEVEG